MEGEEDMMDEDDRQLIGRALQQSTSTGDSRHLQTLHVPTQDVT